MDPLSIATGSIALAKTAFKIARVLHSGIQAVKGVDTTLQAFHREVTALANALDLVGKTCKAPKLNDLDKESSASDGRLSTILQSLRGMLTDCEETLTSLNSVLQQAVSKSSISLFRRSSTALKLNFKSGSIALARQQIQTYISAMQMTISMLNITIILMQHQSSSNNGQIVADVEALEKYEGDLRSRIQDSGFLVSDIFARDKTLNNLKDYLELSQSIRTSATTIYGSEVNSVISNPLDQERSRAIEVWRHNDDPNQQEISFATSISTRRLAFALKNLEQQHYHEAETLLRTCISKPGLDEGQVFEAKSALALCYEGQKNFEIAVQTFLELLELSELSKTQIAHINQNLARINLVNGRAQEALPYALKACENHHNNQRKDAYHDSCRLAAKVYQSLKDFTEAAIYYEEIPARSRHRGKLSCKLIEKFDIGGSFWAMSGLSNDGQLAVLTRKFESLSNAIRSKILLWDMPYCKNIKLLDEECGYIRTGHSPFLQITQDGRRRLYIENGVAQLRELGGESITLQTLSDSDLERGCRFRAFAISPNGRSFVLSTNDAELTCHGLIDNKPVATSLVRDFSCKISLSEIVYGMCFSPDGNILAIRKHAIIELMEFPVFKIIRTLSISDLQGSTRLSQSLAFTPDGLILTSTNGHRILIWEMTTFKIKQILKSHTRLINQVSFSPDGNLLASVSQDRTIKLWEVRSGKLLQTLQGHTQQVENVCFSPDGLYLVSGSTDNTIRLWSVEYD